MDLVDDSLCVFLHRLRGRSTEELREAMAMEAIETGGHYTEAGRGGIWSSHLTEITIHRVTACGHSVEEAIRNWKRAAWATLNVPFPDPRDHAEEIANARAAQQRAAGR